MGYEIDYSRHTEKQAKRDQAIQDIENWLGDRFHVLTTIAMQSEVYKQLSFAAGFAGVQGYPVAALWDETKQEMRDMTT